MGSTVAEGIAVAPSGSVAAPGADGTAGCPSMHVLLTAEQLAKIWGLRSATTIARWLRGESPCAEHTLAALQAAEWRPGHRRFFRANVIALHGLPWRMGSPS